MTIENPTLIDDVPVQMPMAMMAFPSQCLIAQGNYQQKSYSELVISQLDLTRSSSNHHVQWLKPSNVAPQNPGLSITQGPGGSNTWCLRCPKKKLKTKHKTR